jgi:two-component system chemotaxis sensor kinase CheA
MSREAIGKEIMFVVSGGDTKLDKLIIEELSDPLMHLIRNAIDHGIEEQQLRLRARQARSWHRGDQRRAARQSRRHRDRRRRQRHRHPSAGAARHRQRADLEDQARDMTRHEMYELMFLPGLSTRAVADETRVVASVWTW